MGHGPNDLRALAGPNLYSIGSCLAFDLGAPGVRVVDLIDLPNHVAPSEQLSVVISAPHSFDEPFDPALDLDRILHDVDATPFGESPLRQNLDIAANAAGPLDPSVSGQEQGAQRLRQGDIGGVVRGEVVAKLPSAGQQRQMWNPSQRKSRQVIERLTRPPLI